MFSVIVFFMTSLAEGREKNVGEGGATRERRFINDPNSQEGKEPFQALEREGMNLLNSILDLCLMFNVTRSYSMQLLWS